MKAEARTDPTSGRGELSGDRHPGAARSQAGVSLIEVLIAMALITTVVLSIASGLLMLVRTTAATAERQKVEHALGNFGESLKAAPYLPCDGGDATPGGYQSAYSAWPAAWRAPDGITARITGVEHWDRASQTFAACSGDDQGAQLLTLEVDLNDRTGTAQIVKGSR